MGLAADEAWGQATTSLFLFLFSGSNYGKRRASRVESSQKVLVGGGRRVQCSAVKRRVRRTSKHEKEDASK